MSDNQAPLNLDIPVGQFFFSILRDEICRTEKYKFYIQGGRGVGKTPFMLGLTDDLKGSMFFSGRDYSPLKEFLDNEPEKELAGNNSALIIDDIDKFTLNLLRHDRNRCDAIFSRLLNCINILNGEKRKVIMSGNLMAEHMVSPIDPEIIRLKKELPDATKAKLFLFWSLIPTQWDSRSLNPWESPFWRNKFFQKFSAHYDRSEFNQCCKDDKRYVEKWFDVVLDLTGGHPYFFSIATRGLNILLNEALSLSSDDEPLPDVLCDEKFLSNYLEAQIVREGTYPIHASLDRLMTVQGEEYVGLFEALFGIASSEHCSGEIRNVNIETLLINEALVFRNHGVESEIPGKIVCKTILQYKPSAPKIEVVGSELDDRGTINVTDQGGEKTLAIKAAAWKILDHLYSVRPESALVDELVVLGGENPYSQSTVRSAIDRLRSKLEHVGIAPDKVVKRVSAKEYICTIPK